MANAPAVVVPLHAQANPLTALVAGLPQLVVPPPGLSARDFLRQPLPQVPTQDGAASQSSPHNIHFHPVDFLHHGQYTELFHATLGGYPNNLNVNINFYPINPPPHAPQITVESQAVNFGRNYVLQPASFVLQHRIQQLRYDVEVNIETQPIRTGPTTTQSFKGYVDAVYSFNTRPLVMCEFKRPGCFNLDRWQMIAPSQGGQNAMPSMGNEAQKITKQLMKYAYATERPYFILSDWKSFLFIHLDNQLDQGLNKGAYIARTREKVPPPPHMPRRFDAQRSVTRRGMRYRDGNAGWPYLTARAVHCADATQFKIFVFAFVVEAHRREGARNNLDHPGGPGGGPGVVAFAPAPGVGPAAAGDDDDTDSDNDDGLLPDDQMVE
jgi:hypothetical protein